MPVELSKVKEVTDNDINCLIQKIQSEKENLDKDFASLKGLSSRIAIEKDALYRDITNLIQLISIRNDKSSIDFTNYTYNNEVSRSNKTANEILGNIGQVMEDTVNKVANALNDITLK